MNRKMFVALVGVLALALGLAGCGGSSNPASPSSSASSSASTGLSGATISGTVSGTTSGSAAGYQKLDATNGITVTISGTAMTVAVGAQGKFTFTGVPAGTVQIVFTAGGSTATLTLNGVQATDRVTIHVTLRGTTATLDEEQRNGANVTELEDQIAAVNPNVNPPTLVVRGTTVAVPPGVPIRHGNDTIAFNTLKVGDRVHVRGALSGAVMTATEVIVQNTNTNPGVNASGSVSALVARTSCPTLEFVVDSWTVVTSSNTDYQKITCETIAVGKSVHFKGEVVEGGKVRATWIQGK